MTWEALTVGRSTNLGWPVVHLLARAGFAVDAVTSSRNLCCSRLLRTAYPVARPDNVADAARRLIAARGKPYDWVIVTDDTTLTEAAALERAEGTITGLLPLLPGAPRGPLNSKIGLSLALQNAAIRTPDFRVANDAGEVAAAAEALDYPVFVKADAANGGHGVVELGDAHDLDKLRPDVPVLVQKKIDGAVVDVSAIFLDGTLVHHVYAVFEREIRRFGPSALRTYHATRAGPQSLYDELNQLGRALGLNGFTNITCIEARDGSGRYYFEADARPNIWTAVCPFPGEDPADRIRDWFSRRAVTPVDYTAATEAAVRVPMFLRLNPMELAFNRYGVWRTIPRGDPVLIRKAIAQRLFAAMAQPLKPVLPRALQKLGRGYFGDRGWLSD